MDLTEIFCQIFFIKANMTHPDLRMDHVRSTINYIYTLLDHRRFGNDYCHDQVGEQDARTRQEEGQYKQ